MQNILGKLPHARAAWMRLGHEHRVHNGNNFFPTDFMQVSTLSVIDKHCLLTYVDYDHIGFVQMRNQWVTVRYLGGDAQTSHNHMVSQG